MPVLSPGNLAAAIAEHSARRRNRRAPRPWCVRVVTVLLLLLAIVPPAFPHAALVAADPADGSVIEKSPAQFLLTFSEPVSPLALGLVKPDGSRQALRSFVLRDQTLEIAAPAGLDAGTHVLTWRVISEDGHPVGGSVVFSIGAAGAAPVVPDTVDRKVRAGLWAGKVLLYCGLFLGVGGAIAAVWLVPAGMTRRPPRRMLLVLMAAGIAGAVLALGFQGLDALGSPAGRVGDPAVWKAGLGTSFGLTVLLAATALVLGLVSLFLPTPDARFLSFFALVALGAGLAVSGHAASAPPQALTRPAVFLHAITIALWTGALLPLAAAVRQGGEAAAFALRRFSRFIPFALLVLIAAGSALAVVQVEHPAALVNTAYGRVLLVKLALLVVLFGLAAVNRWRLTARTLGGEAAASRHMLRSIRAETGVILLIFATAAVWRFTPPPRALAAAAAVPATLHVGNADGMAGITIAPGRVGTATARITLMAAAGMESPGPKEVALVLGNKAAGIEPFKRAARKTGDGAWQADDLPLPVSGTWQVRVDVLVSDFKMLRLPGEVLIRP